MATTENTDNTIVENNQVQDDSLNYSHYYTDKDGKVVKIAAGGTSTVGQGDFNFGYKAQPQPTVAPPREAPPKEIPKEPPKVQTQPPKPQPIKTPQISGPNKRRYNPLSKFSSVTYRIGLYAISPDAYNNWIAEGRWVTKDLQLLVQSGGINDSMDSPRNKYFDLDMYIDNLEITTKTNAKETRFASNVSNIKFQVFEPYAMTFPTRLIQVQKELQQSAKIKKPIESQVDAITCPFLIVIRFYGYDENGKLVTTDSLEESTNRNFKTDQNAVYERAFPIIISKFNFKLEAKTTVYDIEAKLVNEQLSYGVKRGVFKTPKSIVADTVGSALGGSEYFTNGLLDKLNEEQFNFVKDGHQAIADQYTITYERGAGIEDATIVDEGFYTKEMTGYTVERAEQVNERTAQNQVTVPKNNRTVQISTGTPILTAIDQVITQSTYFRDKMKAFDVDEIQPAQEQDKGSQTVGDKKAFTWYYVRPEIVIKNWDKKRNDWATYINYVVQEYHTPYLRSLVVKDKTQYYGPHKIYQYWYTGQNTEVLNYEMQYNLLYFNVMALGSSESLTSGDNAPNALLPASNASPAGKTPGKNELENSLRTFLTSPGDQAKAQIRILGDPDFLMPVDSASADSIVNKFYGPDGYSVNANSGQVFIEIGFNEVRDYDSNTGLMTPKNNITFWDYSDDVKQQTEGRMIYMVVQVISKFSRGVFIQDLKTIIPPFTKKTKSSTSTTNTDSNRENNANNANDTRTNSQEVPGGQTQNNGEPTNSVDIEECLPLSTNQVQALDGGSINNGQSTLATEYITVNDDSIKP